MAINYLHLQSTLYTEKNRMRFAVDAHVIGRHLTGNEVYVRNLLDGFAALNDEAEFIAYLANSSSGWFRPTHSSVWG
jgi:hypothetical protein